MVACAPVYPTAWSAVRASPGTRGRARFEASSGRIAYHPRRMSLARPITVHPVVIWPYVEAISRLGLTLPDWAREAQAHSDATTRLPYEQTLELLSWAVAFTGRSDLGVLAAEAVEPGHFDLVELAARTQNTVGEALDTVAACAGILHDGLTLELARDGEHAHLRIELPRGAEPHPAAYDFIVATLVISGRRQTRIDDLQPSCVHLPYPEPPGPHPLRRLITSELHFEAEALRLTVPAAGLDIPLSRANASMGQALRDAARELLEARADDALASSVRKYVRSGLADGALSAGQIARKLHMSQRTLRRKLEAHGLRLRELIDQERHAQALSKLKDAALSTDAVASQLGFTTPQAFHRAFKRWTGETVQAYRDRTRARSTRG